MGLIQIKKGLDLPISGEPVQIVHPGKPVKKVAVLGDDYVNMKPQFAVSIGDEVKEPKSDLPLRAAGKSRRLTAEPKENFSPL
jgi:Na+-transporting NADH:ubiquinone oxidoreductase subunit NqrA